MLRHVFAPGSPGGTARLARTPLAALAAIGIIVTSNLAFAKAPPDGFADLAEKVTPAVVNISTTQKVERNTEQMPELPFPPDSPMGEMLRKFFEQQQGHGRGAAAPAQCQRAGLGLHHRSHRVRGDEQPRRRPG